MNTTNEKAKRLLGWSPRSTEEAITATAESLVRLDLLTFLNFIRMDTPGSANISEVFISCKKEAHYSRELILPSPALVHVTDGKVPTESLVPLIKEVRNLEFEDVWH